MNSAKDLRRGILCGVESEYATYAFDRSGRPFSHDETESLVRAALRDLLQDESLPFLESHGGHAILNGGRAYWDRLQSISSAEYSTPEFRNPIEGCAFVQGGHFFYRSLGDYIEAQGYARSVEVHLPGVCLSSGNANGQHLNYYRSIDQPVAVLIPHIASMACICGSGGWSICPNASLEYVLSPRLELISRVSGADSSHNRALVDTYRKPYGLGRRVQDLSSDATHSMLQLYVRIGSTALLLALVDCWNLCLDDLVPVDPIGAVRTWNREPNVAVPIAYGQVCTAMNLQQQIVDRVRTALDRPQGPVPDWAGQVVASWQQLIDAVTNPYHADCVAIDWMLHKALLEHVCARNKLTWRNLPVIAKAHARLAELQNSSSPEFCWEKLRDSQPGQQQLQDATKILNEAHIKWDEFERAVRLQPILHLTSTEFLEVGRGASAVFMAEQRERLPALTDALIKHAMLNAPQDTRAAIRAKFVRKYAGQDGAAAGWEVLRRPDGSIVDLQDPFAHDVEL